MDMVVMNLNESKSEQSKVEMVKQEAADDILLELPSYEVHTVDRENVLSEDNIESTSLNTFDVIGNRSLEPKLETSPLDCWLGDDEKISVKQDVLHEELDIKSEDEPIQETPIDDKHNWGNQLAKDMKDPSKVKLLCAVFVITALDSIII